jgi:hypothetical protein
VARRAYFHPAGDRVLLAFEGSSAYEYLFAPGKGLQTPPSTLGDAPAKDVATSGSGTWTLVAEQGGPLRPWRRDEDGENREKGRLELEAESLQSSRTNDLVGAILAGGGAAVIDCSAQPEVTARFVEGESVNAIRFSEDGRRVALATAKGHLLVVELDANGSVLIDERLVPHSPSQTGIFDLSFYDAGRRLVSAGPEGGVVLWDVETGRVLEHIEPEGATVSGALVLGDGRQLLGREQWGVLVALTDLASGHAKTHLRLAPFRGSHRNRVTAWSLDNMQQRLLTTSLDHTATIWDLDLALAWVTFAGHDNPILAGDLSRDGKWAVTADSSGQVYVWPTDPLSWAKKALPIDTRPDPR